MNLVENQGKTSSELEGWAVNLLASLVHTAVEALNKKPFKMLDYVETTFRHGVTGVQIRVEFKEFSDSEDQLVTPPESSDKDELGG